MEPVFSLVARAPMDPSEVERPRDLALEVTVRWGDRLLRAQHLAIGERFTVGRDPADTRASLCVDAAELDASAASDIGRRALWTLAVHDDAGLFARFPSAVGLVVEGDAAALSITKEPDDTTRVALAPGALVRCELGGLELSLRAVKAPRAAVRRSRFDRSFVGALLGALVALVSVGSIVYGLSSPRTELLSDGLSEERDAMILHWVARQREWSTTQPLVAEGTATDSQPSGTAPGPSGSQGAFEAPRRVSRSAVRDRGLVPQLARMRARELVASRGIFSALGAPSDQHDTQAPESPFGGLLSSGHDTTDAWGSSDAGLVADSFGYGGLGRLNSGHNGVSSGGSGLGSTCGVDTCDLGSLGYGQGVGALIGMRRLPSGALRPLSTRGPTVRPMPMTVDGAYSREIVRRVIRRNIGQVQRCFEQALSRNADASGRIMVRFVLAPDGQVVGASATENSTGDAALGACVAGAFRRWQFPPSDSVVTVNYPVMLRVD
jgi:TonB family protein